MILVCPCAIFIVVGIFIHVTGACVGSTIVPESGSIIAGDEGTPNITLYCDLRNENGDRLIVTWFMQTRQGPQQPIPLDDDNFEFSGVTIEVANVGNFAQNSNLTIASLTDELDDVIIICSFDASGAEFNLRIYRKYYGIHQNYTLPMNYIGDPITQ